MEVGDEFLEVNILDEVGEERQSSPLTAERPVTEQSDVAVGVYEFGVELNDASP